MAPWPRTVLSVIASLLVFYLLFIKWGWNPIVAGGITIVLYFALDLLLKPRRRLGGVDVESMLQGEELFATLEDADQDLKKIERITKSIRDEDVKAESEALYESGRQLLDYLVRNPGKITLARRFFNYYLDLAVEILEQYQKLVSTRLQTPDVLSAKERSVRAIPQLRQAFEKQFTSLIGGEILDLEAEIKVLEDTLRMENL